MSKKKTTKTKVTAKPKTVKSAAKPAVKPKTAAFTVVLKLNETEYTGTSNMSLESALSKIKPAFYKTRGVLQVFAGGLSTEKLMTIWQMKRLFNNEITRAVLAKQLKMVLK